MRSLVVDPLRLLLRWAINQWGAQVIAFAACPTRREVRAVIRRHMDGLIDDFVAKEKVRAEQHSTLH